MILRREQAPDRPEILALIEAAFPDGGEVRLLRELFASREYLPELSIVAESADGEILGHVISTRAWIGDAPAVGLGPIGVLPARQRQGIGAALMHASIDAARVQGEPAIVLLGSTGFYPRFGFVPADSVGIASPDPSWGSHFMALPLPGFHAGIRGRFRYAEPFSKL